MIGSDTVSRRRLLRQAAGLAGAALTPAALAAPAFGRAPAGGDDPFTLGVASGEPAPDGVVIWTRLAPRPLDSDGGMPPLSVPVRWEVAEDPGFRRIVRRGRALAGPAAGHAVHVEVDGLKPARDYWYRFSVRGGSSPIGRTVTAPAAGAVVERLRLAFGSCQKYEAGFYGAYRHMVAEHPDLFLFLGDYIYEGAPGSRDAVRLHQNPEPTDVAGYRARYATYKSDPLLQDAHAACPWMVIWDDHEVANDHGGDRAGDQNLSQGFNPAAFLRRRAAAYQAYYEHMPLRRRSRPVGPDMLLYRSLNWGGLAQIQFLDDRQYRSPRACVPASVGEGKDIPDCPERRDPSRSMLGDAQERWLLDTLSGSRARWNLLAQQTLFVPSGVADPTAPGRQVYSSDGWDGAPATRDRIAARWRDAKVSNPMVLGGDIHKFAAADCRVAGGEVVAPVFVGGSISSLEGVPSTTPAILAANPDIKLLNGQVRGYGLVDIRVEGATIAFRSLADARREDTPVSTLASFTVEAGRPQAHGA